VVPGSAGGLPAAVGVAVTAIGIDSAAIAVIVAVARRMVDDIGCPFEFTSIGDPIVAGAQRRPHPPTE
jgi:hypothetical protein